MTDTMIGSIVWQGEKLEIVQDGEMITIKVANQEIKVQGSLVGVKMTAPATEDSHASSKKDEATPATEVQGRKRKSDAMPETEDTTESRKQAETTALRLAIIQQVDVPFDLPIWKNWVDRANTMTSMNAVDISDDDRSLIWEAIIHEEPLIEVSDAEAWHYANLTQ
ncbi:hypothetical protein BU24DRAFT_468752 [Aaosphaeria arxii CBS 175.79]|uniref:Uncharacterized protein n=1 Tax=Aaosphaeria arxii CBS 175.79 TaxID=1450172 RepID=A0A6A5X6U9_9PLEO|nr:uncharacterized protein BU24DRAFT_468752 [Aaosphaeria arxii CBS 175.79]KAF2008640.1 hypothetical protein BU24DRAFT_468752 [Aaosphaeria arxii CBS 175.79]